eukprot:TRINITY_DN3759_c0_g1_i4.p1 TRINITY_DN3759_c0_g1~~TRINITY_DN3759_c0_g1_i4.p1  ORF type:complete len:140 (+),score=11.00 TRINITY_DN3759_c0_g1_i4:25-420(+)
MIRRPPRSTHCISSAASDVYKRQSLNCVSFVTSFLCIGSFCTCSSGVDVLEKLIAVDSSLFPFSSLLSCASVPPLISITVSVEAFSSPDSSNESGTEQNTFLGSFLTIFRKSLSYSKKLGLLRILKREARA